MQFNTIIISINSKCHFKKLKPYSMNEDKLSNYVNFKFIHISKHACFIAISAIKKIKK